MQRLMLSDAERRTLRVKVYWQDDAQARIKIAVNFYPLRCIVASCSFRRLQRAFVSNFFVPPQ